MQAETRSVSAGFLAVGFAQGGMSAVRSIVPSLATRHLTQYISRRYRHIFLGLRRVLFLEEAARRRDRGRGFCNMSSINLSIEAFRIPTLRLVPSLLEPPGGAPDPARRSPAATLPRPLVSLSNVVLARIRHLDDPLRAHQHRYLDHTAQYTASAALRKEQPRATQVPEDHGL